MIRSGALSRWTVPFCGGLAVVALVAATTGCRDSGTGDSGVDGPTGSGGSSPDGGAPRGGDALALGRTSSGDVGAWPDAATALQPMNRTLPETFLEAERRADETHTGFVRGLRAMTVAWCDRSPAGAPLVMIETMGTVGIRAYSGGVELERGSETIVASGSFFDPETRTVFVDADLAEAARARATRLTSLVVALTLVDGFAQAIEHEAHDRRTGERLARVAPTPRLKGALIGKYLIPRLSANALSVEAVEEVRRVVEAAEQDIADATPDRVLLGRMVTPGAERWAEEFVAGLREGVKSTDLGRSTVPGKD